MYGTVPIENSKIGKLHNIQTIQME